MVTFIYVNFIFFPICRYKNIFSPYNEFEENEKKIGSFYEPINLKVASIIGFEHQFGK